MGLSGINQNINPSVSYTWFFYCTVSSSINLFQWQVSKDTDFSTALRCSLFVSSRYQFTSQPAVTCKRPAPLQPLTDTLGFDLLLMSTHHLFPLISKVLIFVSLSLPSVLLYPNTLQHTHLLKTSNSAAASEAKSPPGNCEWPCADW